MNRWIHTLPLTLALALAGEAAAYVPEKPLPAPHAGLDDAAALATARIKAELRATMVSEARATLAACRAIEPAAPAAQDGAPGRS